ncbi:hypothetical protein QVD17_18240 [Tagetes erecta]|uniref:Uncharacterized protein n=1 Tax=Tagetes erecta TaxID=13708 RepID=A0AAD8KNQ2_TARER|nr:hypothetical protein QVD17_18240 [Tagetes erecta]
MGMFLFNLLMVGTLEPHWTETDRSQLELCLDDEALKQQCSLARSLASGLRIKRLNSKKLWDLLIYLHGLALPSLGCQSYDKQYSEFQYPIQLLIGSNVQKGDWQETKARKEVADETQTTLATSSTTLRMSYFDAKWSFIIAQKIVIFMSYICSSKTLNKEMIIFHYIFKFFSNVVTISITMCYAFKCSPSENEFNVVKLSILSA